MSETPTNNTAKNIAIGASAIVIGVGGLTLAAHEFGLPSDIDTYAKISEHKKNINDNYENLIKFQYDYLKQTATINSGNSNLDKKIISVIEDKNNEVFRYLKEDELKKMEAGLVLAPNQVAIVDIPNNSNYLVDGKIKLGYYDTLMGEFSLLSEFTDYKDLDDSPKKVKSLFSKNNDSHKISVGKSRYVLALINDGEGDVTVTDGSRFSIEDIYTQAYGDYKNSNEVAVNIIDLSSKIVPSGNSIYPIADIRGNDFSCYTFKKLEDGRIKSNKTNLLGEVMGDPDGKEFFIKMKNHYEGHTPQGLK